MTASRVMPGSTAVDKGRVTIAAVGGHDEGRRGRAFGDEAVLHHPGFEHAGLRGFLLRQDLGEQRDGLDVPPFPAQVRRRDTATPLSACGERVMTFACVNITTVGAASFGKAKSRSAAPRVTCM